MPFHASLKQLQSAVSANTLALPELGFATGITTDTREVLPGQVFLALRGERFDGHAFVETAIAKGAIAAIVDHAIDSSSANDLPLLIVPDTLTAYQAIARWWREQFLGKVVAVTGSVGKTTTKELIAGVLATYGSVLKTKANYNNEIGVPKTLLELDESHDYAVIEMGMRAAGEIALLADIAKPDIAVITNVGTAHIGRLGSEQAIANAKCELLGGLPSDGVAILNYDNTRLTTTASRCWQGKVITFGLTGGDIQGRLLDSHTLQVNGLTLPLPLAGQHNALNYLAALAVAQCLGLDWSMLTKGLTIELPQGRARQLQIPQDIVFLDETYNAGLESMQAALKLLMQTPGQRHIAVLGTMKELGDRSVEFHHQVGVWARELGVDHLFILADAAETEAMQDGAHSMPTQAFSDATEVVEALQQTLRPGDRVLFKASRAVQLDRVVDDLIASRSNSSTNPTVV